MKISESGGQPDKEIKFQDRVQNNTEKLCLENGNQNNQTKRKQKKPKEKVKLSSGCGSRL